MAKPSSNLRLFVAAYPPADLAAAALEAIDALDLPPHRLTTLDQIHLTLQFVGDTPVHDLDAVSESVINSAAGIPPFTLKPQQLISLPEKPPTRLVALRTSSSPHLLELHNRLVTRLATLPRKDARESFLPHFTLCRFSSPQPLFKLSFPVTLPPFIISQIHLMRSTLSHAGAQHHTLATIALNA